MKCEAANCTGGNWAGRPSGKMYAMQKQSQALPERDQTGRRWLGWELAGAASSVAQQASRNEWEVE